MAGWRVPGTQIQTPLPVSALYRSLQFWKGNKKRQLALKNTYRITHITKWGEPFIVTTGKGGQSMSETNS